MRFNHMAVRLFSSMIFILAVFICDTANAISQSPSQNTVFVQLADEYFDRFYFPQNPSEATQLGVHLYDDKLEDYSKAGILREIATLKKYESRVGRINSTELDDKTQADRELLLNDIRSQLLTLQTIRLWEKDPDTYSSGVTESIFVLIKRQFATTENRLRSVIAREKLIPAVFDEAHKNINNPPKLYTEITLEQLPGLVKFFQNDVPAVFSKVNDENLKKQFAESNAAVIKALLSYQVWLKNKVLPHSHGDFRIGKATFIKKLKYDEMVDTPLDKLIAIDLANMRQNQTEFKRIAKEIDPHKSTQQVLTELVENHPAPDDLLKDFQSKFANLIKFIHDKKIITIPSDIEPMMEETPPFLHAITAASMDIPGPFEKTANEAYFNVTLPDSSWSKEKMNDYMTAFSYPAISSVAVHEAYPGHYVQFLWVQQIHDRLRQILGARTNSEGWAHYCEQMMLDEGLASPAYGVKDAREAQWMKLGQLLEALWRNARFIVGIEMHTGKMTFDQAVDFFVKEGYQSRAVGIMEAKRAASDPTYLYYTLGKLQILKLRADVEKKEGANFNLQKFHDDFMRQGFPPIKIVRKAMLHDDSPTL